MGIDPATDRIFARASAPGKSGIAVYRLSGDDLNPVIDRLVRKKLHPREARLASVYDPSGEVIDKGLCLFFPGPESFTGEDVLEFHLHGSVSVEQALSQALVKSGLRPAEPGEFTFRALKNGKLDLAQVEALADLIDSETSEQRKQALGQLDGELSNRVFAWRELLLQILAPLTAEIDFPDEDDVPKEIARQALVPAEKLIAELEDALARAGGARRIRNGASVVLMGPPNVGKSSLMNRVARNDVAIVSAIPGTTRDVVETRLDLDGVLVMLADTAGIRSLDHTSKDPNTQIEALGIDRTRRMAEEADIRIWVLDGSRSLTEQMKDVPRETFSTVGCAQLCLLNKSDLADPDIPETIPAPFTANTIFLPISAKTGEGVDQVLGILKDMLSSIDAKSASGALTRERHVDRVQEALKSVHRAKQLFTSSPELAAEDIQNAIRSLDELVGKIHIEDILGEIFSRFCIGK